MRLSRVRLGEKRSSRSRALLWPLVYPRSRTSSPDRRHRCIKLLATLESGGCMTPSILSSASRSLESKEEERHDKAVCFSVYRSICMFCLVRLFFPTDLGDRWCEGSLGVCLYRGPDVLVCGFTNLGKSHHRTPVFRISKYPALLR